MATFITAYLAVWLAVVLFVGRLDHRQRRLRRELDQLLVLRAEDSGSRHPPSRAA